MRGLKCCVKNEIKCSEALKMIKQAFGDDAMSQLQIYEWYKFFQEDSGNDTKSEQSSTSMIDKNM